MHKIAFLRYMYLTEYLKTIMWKNFMPKLFVHDSGLHGKQRIFFKRLILSFNIDSAIKAINVLVPFSRR